MNHIDSLSLSDVVAVTKTPVKKKKAKNPELQAIMLATSGPSKIQGTTSRIQTMLSDQIIALAKHVIHIVQNGKNKEINDHIGPLFASVNPVNIFTKNATVPAQPVAKAKKSTPIKP